MLLEDDPVLTNLFGMLIEEAKFECVPIGTTAGFWKLFSTELAAVIVDDEVCGSSFISDGGGSNIMKIRELAPAMPIGLNSSYPKRDMAERYRCVDLRKDKQEIISFLRAVQVRYVRQT